MTIKWFQCRYFKAFVAYAGCNVGLAVAAGALCAFVAPAAAGSGIPEVKAYLNGIDAHSILAPSTLFVKVFGRRKKNYQLNFISFFVSFSRFTYSISSTLYLEDFGFYSRSVCRICGGKRRAYGTYRCLHSLFAWAGRFSQIPLDMFMAKILQE